MKRNSQSSLEGDPAFCAHRKAAKRTFANALAPMNDRSAFVEVDCGAFRVERADMFRSDQLRLG